jgi:hypothetical protein
MQVTLCAGPLDGLEVNVPAPPPKYIEADTGRGAERRTHVYALRGDKYVYLRTRKKG